jgi:uncharacterized protein YbgA (DUF1722 family)/uncharacterized protein YbbK (DUF523 family)
MGGNAMDDGIKLGVSACLLGQKVRYDGGHKLDRFIQDTLGPHVAFVPVCPEVECGLGVPREAMRLVGDPEAPRLMTVRTGLDHTDRMRRWAQRRLKELEKEDLCGFIFKGGSPSSGMERVKVYTEQGMPSKTGVGMFARAFMAHFPLIPVEEDGRLNDARLRENFIERIFAMQRWRQAAARGARPGVLVDFHTRHKLLVLSHSPKHQALMGKLVARAREIPASTLFEQYQALLMEALRLKASPSKHANVLMHIMGYFKKDLTPDEKQELLEVIGRYKGGHIPLIVPVTLLRHYVRKYNQPYLREQVYLDPHPVELQLRNHV